MRDNPGSGASAGHRDEICFLSAREIARRIAGREISAVEVLDAHLSRIEEHDGTLRTYLHVDRAGALAAARRADAMVKERRDVGPIHGVPLALKDAFHVRGMPISMSSAVLRGRRSTISCRVAERLADAGAIILGKLNTTEFQSGGLDAPGYALNPWDTSRTPGSSSSGSGAALAAGLAALSVGGDTGGSVRLPAAFCGVVGLRPTPGRVSRKGIFPLSWTYDVPGPMARTVADVADLLAAISGYDPSDANSSDQPIPKYGEALSVGIRGLRLGVPERYFFDDIDPEVERSVRKAIATLESLGGIPVEVSLPSAHFGPAVQWALAFPEAFEYHRNLFFSRRREYGDAFVRKIASSAFLSSTELAVARRLEARISADCQATLSKVDAIVTPTAACAAYRVEDFVAMQQDVTRLTRTASVAGLPALAIPCGFTAEGLPVSLQVMAKPWDEATLLRIGYAYEQATTWHLRRAPIADLDASAEARVVRNPERPPEPLDVAWIRDRAKADGFGFLSESDYAPLARLLMPVRRRLAEGREYLKLEDELLSGVGE